MVIGAELFVARVLGPVERCGYGVMGVCVVGRLAERFEVSVSLFVGSVICV